jgi:hypothetical protein
MINSIDILLNNKELHNKYDPYIYSLNKIEANKWFIFGTITFGSESRRADSPKAQKQREYDFKRLMNEFSRRLELKPRNLPYYWTTEYSLEQEKHLHFLIANNGIFRDRKSVDCALMLKNLWKNELRAYDSEFGGIGEADIRAYDQALGMKGVNYCLKRQYDERGSQRDKIDEISKPLFKMILNSTCQPFDPSQN